MAGRPGYHYRRGGWAKNPTPKAKASSKWIMWAVVAVLAYAALHSCFSGSSSGTPSSSKATAKASASAAR